MKRIILSDLHLPYHDPWLLEQWLLFVGDQKPTHIDIIGDFIDCYTISKFDKNPARKETLQDEFDLARKVLDRIRKAAPQSEIHYSEGNHEDRLRKVLWGKAACLASLRDLSIPQLLGLDRFGVFYHPLNAPYQVGPLWYTHGNVIRKHAGSSARAMSDRYNGSLICGHSHRMGFIPHNYAERQHGAWECGHMCDPSLAEYVNIPNWQGGWLMVEFPQQDLFDVSFIRAVTHEGFTYLLHKGEQL